MGVELRVNDIVRIANTSTYYIGTPHNPKDIDGVVVQVENTCIEVKWGTGRSNWYISRDLVIMSSILWE